MNIAQPAQATPVWRFGNSPVGIDIPERISESPAALANQ
jgi:hypothetical protein